MGRHREVRVSRVTLVGTWISQLVLWLIFADNTGFREIIVGAIAATIGTFFVASFIARTGASFQFRPRWIAQAIHIPEILFSGTGILLRVVAMRLAGKDVPGGIVAVKFDAGHDDARSRGKRAIATTYLTFAPNNLVLGVPSDQQILFFHTVIPQPLPSFMNNLGARIEQEK